MIFVFLHHNYYILINNKDINYYNLILNIKSRIIRILKFSKLFKYYNNYKK